METLTLKQAPDIARIVKFAFPDYRKKKAFLSVFSSTYGVNINSYWDGGSRSEFAVVNMETGERLALPTRTHPFYEVRNKGMANTENQHVTIDGGGNITLKFLPEGFALVEAGAFCGKPATAHVFLPAENMPKYLIRIPAPTDEELRAMIQQ
jgi:hypothetical protein